MADQNPQVNQNLNNQNENDELFGGSDDIFENSDLLQPINTEVDTAHQVVKSQNDLNNFQGEVQPDRVENSENIPSNNTNPQIEQFNEPEHHEDLESDDLFEQPQVEQNIGDEHLHNLYDEEKEDETVENADNYGINDDIFESSEKENDFQDIPEVIDYDEDTQDNTEQEKNEPQEQLENLEPIEDTPQTENNTYDNSGDDEDFQNDLNSLKELDDIDDEDDRDDENEEVETKDEEKEEIKDEEKNEENFDEKSDEHIEENPEEKENFNENEEATEDEENFDENEEDENTESHEEIDDSEVNNESLDDFDDEEIQEDNTQTAEEKNEKIIVQDYEKYDPNQFNTDIQKKFGELQWKTERIHELVGKDQDVGFDLLGGNDERQKTTYKILSGSDYVEIEKEELNKEDQSITTNTLAFVLQEDLEQNRSLQLLVNEIELYDEIKDLQNDPNKKMQVLEKMNKFIFLLDEEYKKIQKYKKEKEERNAVKGIFRNF